MYAFIWMHIYISIIIYIYIIYIITENGLAVLLFNFNESSDF